MEVWPGLHFETNTQRKGLNGIKGTPEQSSQEDLAVEGPSNSLPFTAGRGAINPTLLPFPFLHCRKTFTCIVYAKCRYTFILLNVPKIEMIHH